MPAPRTDWYVWDDIIEASAPRFWQKVEQTAGCWWWHGSRQRGGYGAFKLKKPLNVKAHTLSWVMKNGPIPDGLCVLHHCDNPSCINPAHLFLGTQRDNYDDAVAKGRHVSFPAVRQGEANYFAKLNEAQAREILTSTKSTASLARIYKISETTIYGIRVGRRWRHLGLSARSNAGSLA